MKFFKRNINAILGTVLFHLTALVVAMFLNIRTTHTHEESYTYVELDFIEEILNESSADKSDNSSVEDFNIEDYISQIRNTGGNYSSQSSSANNRESMAMSQDELKNKYETELLKEKYGDDYEKMMNNTYENYISESENDGLRNNSQNDKNNNSSSYSGYSGPALVFVELDNRNRGNSYIDVPVFTCRDGGTVVIGININNDGKVRSVNVISVKSNGDADCIINAAKEAALKSRFTTVSGSGTENGKITYQFIQQ